MILQFAIGSGIILSTILMAAMAVLAMEEALLRGHHWLTREPQRLRLLAVVVAVMVLVLGVLSAGVWAWALAFHLIGAFARFEEAMYFALVAYTTLGFGDVLPPDRWRILGGMAAANGFLTFGLLTALMVEALRHVRLHQHTTRAERQKGQP
jgi:hypothetical protein